MKTMHITWLLASRKDRAPRGADPDERFDESTPADEQNGTYASPALGEQCFARRD